jgi:ribosomal-protein-alanine N-acetyltransferase
MGNSPYQKQSVSIRIRAMIRRDMPEVLKIENESFEFKWTEEDFLACMRQRNCNHMVAEHNNHVVGFMIYELHKTCLHVLNFAVASTFRRLQVGAQMIEGLVNKLSQQRRQEIVLEVRETNLAAQLFYHNQGFRAEGILRKHYADSNEDAYVMRYRLDGEYKTPSHMPVNRISQY